MTDRTDHSASLGAAGPTPGLESHFSSRKQQYSAVKLGMWLFLATELLLFGGLFCVYAIYRANNPEIFAYGAQFLDTNWGSLNTVILLLSSFTMAMAVRAAQVGQRSDLVVYLALTILCGANFMGVKSIEYAHKFHKNLLWGERFEAPYTDAQPAPDTAPREIASDVAPVLPEGNVDKGRTLYRATCTSCHGMEGQGVPGQGRDMRDSVFISRQGDAELLAFLKKGRMPNDPDNETGRMMPARGGNPMLGDQDLLDIIAFMRMLQERFIDAGAGAPPVAAGVGPAPEDLPEALDIPRWIIPPPPDGPVGLSDAYLAATATGPEKHGGHGPVPRNRQTFFAVYFSLTGLHAIHVLAGMGVLLWLFVGALQGRFGAAYYTPVDLGGLYWHLVDVIWLFLFPLLYLIH